jgi:hypothetical protein
MTYLAYSLHQGNIYVAQDTLATKVDTTPFFCLEKTVYFPHLNCLVAGTGSLTLQFNAWHTAWNSETLSEFLSKLPAILGDWQTETAKTEPTYLTNSTVFVFFFDDGNPSVTRLTFTAGQPHPVVEDVSTNLNEGDILVKPEILVKPYNKAFELRHKKTIVMCDELGRQEGLTALMARWALASHLTDCNSPKSNQVGIGGEALLFILGEDGLIDKKTILAFPDNNKHGVNLTLLSVDEAVAKSQE